MEQVKASIWINDAGEDLDLDQMTQMNDGNVEDINLVEDGEDE